MLEKKQEIQETQQIQETQETQETQEKYDDDDVTVFTIDMLEKLNVDEIKLEKPTIIKTNKSKLFFCKLSNELLIQTNNLTTVNDIYKQENKTFINLQLDCESLSEKLLEIDNKIIMIIKDNFKKWFKKNVSIESILEYFIPTKMYTNDLTGFFISEIPTYENEIDINIYDENNTLLDNQQIPQIRNSTNIIKLNGVFLEKNKFYCNWEIVQMKINENQNENI